jgi:hypothetical protein
MDDPGAAVGALRKNILEIPRMQPGFGNLRDPDADDVETGPATFMPCQV